MPTSALVLSPQGHVEHALTGVDDGEAFTAHTEPGAGAALVELPGPDAVHDARRDRRRSPTSSPWSGARWAGEAGSFELVPRDQLTAYAAAAGPACGLWAFEALRIARGEPRLGLDTDHRTIPNEVGWIGAAVHLDKGCYRGQETVARVHNLGRPAASAGAAAPGRLGGHPARPAAPTSPPTVAWSASSAPRRATTSWARSRWAWSSATCRSTPTLVADGVPAAQEVLVDPEVGLHVRAGRR